MDEVSSHTFQDDIITKEIEREHNNITKSRWFRSPSRRNRKLGEERGRDSKTWSRVTMKRRNLGVEARLLPEPVGDGFAGHRPRPVSTRRDSWEFRRIQARRKDRAGFSARSGFSWLFRRPPACYISSHYYHAVAHKETACRWGIVSTKPSGHVPYAKNGWIGCESGRTKSDDETNWTGWSSVWIGEDPQ